MSECSANAVFLIPITTEMQPSAFPHCARSHQPNDESSRLATRKTPASYLEPISKRLFTYRVRYVRQCRRRRGHAEPRSHPEDVETVHRHVRPRRHGLRLVRGLPADPLFRRRNRPGERVGRRVADRGGEARHTLLAQSDTVPLPEHVRRRAVHVFHRSQDIPHAFR